MSRYIDIHTHHPTFCHIEPVAIGIHPWQAESEVFDSDKFVEATLIGEVGLDYACDVDPQCQLDLLRRQLSLAEQMQLPVILHCVKAFEPMMKILSEYRLRAVIFHGFIGSPQQAERAVARGYYLSFGEMAFRSPKSLKAMRAIPLSRLFAETDESTLPIEEIYSRIAELRAVTIEELKLQIEENYKNIFNLH